MSFIKEYLIFIMIGALPSVISNYNIFTWEWWAIVLTLDIAVFIHADEMHSQWSK
jgi:hypothetical protein